MNPSDEQATLNITELSPEGWGKGLWTRADGLTRPCLVPCTLPGEKVVARIFRIRRTFMGAPISLIQTSNLRTEALCPHFSTCGGCTWQHMRYDAQLKEKEERIRSLFPQNVTFNPIIACEPIFHYRNKMEFSFSEDLAGNRFLGLISRASKGRVFNVQECQLMNPWVNETLQVIRAWWAETGVKAYYMPKNSGSLRTVTMREAGSGDRLIMLTVSGNPEYALKRAQLDRFVELCKEVAAPKEATLSIILRIHQAMKGSPTQMYEMRLFGPDSFREVVSFAGQNFEFHISPGSFFQPNSRQASRLYTRALELASLSADSVLYDLYAGIGIFGMLASTKAKQVISIELSKDSAYDAKINSDHLKLSNFRIIQGDVAKVLEDKTLPKADVAIVDPPRSGLGKSAIEQILKLNPETLVYVSCNPITQAQDVIELTKGGYVLEEVQPIDQFPHTIHVENIVRMKRLRT